jgi:hypothetical protein
MTLDMAGCARNWRPGAPIVHSPQAGPVMSRPVAEIRTQQAELRKLAEVIGFPDPAAGCPRCGGPAEPVTAGATTVPAWSGGSVQQANRRPGG